jgi:hypothetical protein
LNEPFTDERLEDRLQQVSEAFPHTYLEISTNMSLCDDDRAKKTLDVFSSHPAQGEIWITHNGINKESFERLMGLNYEKTLRNIINLLQLNKGRVFIKIRGLGSSRDGKIRYFSPYEYLKYWEDVLFNCHLDIRNIFPDAFGTFHNRAGNVRLPGWEYQKDFGLHPDCYRLKSLHIDNECLAVGCCMDYEHEEVYGDLKKQTIDEIYNSEEYKTFYKKATGEIQIDENFLCRKCMSPGG